MRTDGITIGVFALDQIQSPRPGAGKGWAATLTRAWPELRPGVTEVPLPLFTEAEGLRLAADTGPHARGTAVEVEPIPGSALFLIRVARKPFGVASPNGLQPGAAQGYPADPTALAGFVADTLIDTPDGPRAAGMLSSGDLVTTLSNGSRPVEWVGRRRVTVLELLAYPGLRPVVLAPGTVGNDRALCLSPRQRLLIDDWRAEVFFGEDRVLTAAEALVDADGPGMTLPDGDVDYVMLLCDSHEILIANGALSESFHPGDSGLAALTGEERASLARVVSEADLIRRRAAFPIVQGAEARALRLPG